VLNRRIAFSALAALSVWVLDRATKISALRHLTEDQSIPVLGPWLNLTLHHNTGAAFGMGAHAPAALTLFATALTIFLLVWWARSAGDPRRAVQTWSLALILGGSAGNLFDRYRYGAVIDFIDLKVWPIFNAADSAITCGAVLWAASILLKRPEAAR
jgi:signal peptidase II